MESHRSYFARTIAHTATRIAPAVFLIAPALFTLGCGDSESGNGTNSGGSGNTSAGGMGGGTGNAGGVGAAGGGGSGGGGEGGIIVPNNADCTPPEGELPAVELTQITTAVAPLLIKNAPGDDDRLYIVEQGGTIMLLLNGAQTPFLDIDDLVQSGGERGLLGLAFHPDYQENGRFFVHYSDNSGDTQIVEFARSADPNIATATPVQTIYSAEQPASNHNGGSIEFSPVDGYLYVFLGDGGGADDTFGNGQNINTPLATALRFDVDGAAPYAIPPGNMTQGLPEIFSYGLRNPYRTSFDICTGDLYIADVGQNQIEEVNISAPGVAANYGWNTMEGTACFQAASCDMTGLTLPVAEYTHGQGCSITGGYVYRGASIPGLRGTYFYGDYCSGNIWSLRKDGDTITEHGIVIPSGLGISGFGQDNRGEVYVTDLGGAIYQIVAQ